MFLHECFPFLQIEVSYFVGNYNNILYSTGKNGWFHANSIRDLVVLFGRNLPYKFQGKNVNSNITCKG